MRRARRADPQPPLGAPAGLRAARFRLGDDQFVVLTYPLAPPPLPRSLTAVEREVALAVLAGLSNSEIAASRGKSLRTVANQVASILRKMRVTSRSQLVAAIERLQRS